MKRVRILGVAAALGLVAYAVVVASRREPRAPSTAGNEADATVKAHVDQAPREPAGARAKPLDRADRAAHRETPGGPRPAPAQVVGGGPAVAAPEIDYDKTLDELEHFVEDLEEKKSRGERIAQPEFVESYRRGNDLVQALMRAPEANDDVQRKFIGGLNERFRKTIMALERPVP